jgi:hypothetical protein
MSEMFVTGVLCAMAGALTSEFVRRLYNNTNNRHKIPLAAREELTDLTANVEDLLVRVDDLEASVRRFWKMRGD